MRRILFFAFLLLPGCSGVSYLAENGIGQWKMFNRARPVEDVLASPQTSEAARRAIQVVKRAKDFAVKDLGLHATKNYQTFVQLDAPCVVWAVSAADPIELKERKWKFPIVGEVPYLGFFKKESAEAEAKRLGAEPNKPDTWVRCVPAFSSLGWFSDPLYSSMLKGNDRDIADTVIHESLHATVWVGNNVDFNEKLANFVGLEGSLRFMQKEGGEEALADGRREVAGEKVFAEFLHGAIAEYAATVRTLAQKQKFYASFADRYRTYADARAKKEKFKLMPVKLETWNNAALMAYANYYSDYSVLETMLKKCGGSLKRFVSWIERAQEKEKGRFKSAPEESLEQISKSEGCPD
ncbi:MAG: aminopeptidase [Bacteriovoracia bacterium]